MKPFDPAPRDDRWLLRARELLQRQAAVPDPTLQRRLQQLRRAALEPAPRRLRAAGFALAGASAALLLAIGLLRLPLPGWPGSDPADLPAAPALRAETPIEQALTLPEEDWALLAGEVDYALVEELEFYAWLEQGDEGG